jgi:hypothetical protein
MELLLLFGAEVHMYMYMSISIQGPYLYSQGILPFSNGVCNAVCCMYVPMYVVVVVSQWGWGRGVGQS